MAKALNAYLLHARALDPPPEIIRIAFEGSQLVAYLRLPKASQPVPVVIAIAGLDSRKENVAETYAAALPFGIGFIAIDSPAPARHR